MTRYIITCVNRIVAEPGDFLLVEDNNVVEAFKNPYADLHVEPAANVVPATPKPAVAVSEVVLPKFADIMAIFNAKPDMLFTTYEVGKALIRNNKMTDSKHVRTILSQTLIKEAKVPDGHIRLVPSADRKRCHLFRLRQGALPL